MTWSWKRIALAIVIIVALIWGSVAAINWVFFRCESYYRIPDRSEHVCSCDKADGPDWLTCMRSIVPCEYARNGDFVCGFR